MSKPTKWERRVCSYCEKDSHYAYARGACADAPICLNCAENAVLDNTATFDVRAAVVGLLRAFVASGATVP